jgi:hypothetical protein
LKVYRTNGSAALFGFMSRGNSAILTLYPAGITNSGLSCGAKTWSFLPADGSASSPGKINVAAVSNASIGYAALNAGIATVSTTVLTANSKVFVRVATPGGVQGFLSVPTILAGASFPSSVLLKRKPA